jgi:hypothetical protein
MLRLLLHTREKTVSKYGDEDAISALLRYSYCVATTGLSENQRDDALWKHDVTMVSNKPFVVFHSP